MALAPSAGGGSGSAGVLAGPPLATVGWLGWIRGNLFNGWLNTLLTVAIAYLLFLIVPRLADWLIFDAVWTEAKPEDCRKAGGACWAFVREKHRIILFGRYTYAEQWRPLLAMALLIGTLIYSCDRRHWKSWLAWVWLAASALFFILMGGGDISISYRTLAMVAGAALVANAVRGAIRGRGTSVPMLGGGILLLLLALFGDWALHGVNRLLMSRAGFQLPFAAVAAFTVDIPTGLAPVATGLWGGLPLTLMLSIFGIAAAFPLGILLALGRRSKMPVIRMLCVAYIELIRGVPLISLLFVASFVLLLFLPSGVNLGDAVRAQVAIIMFSAAYLAEVVRGGLQAIPKGQYEAAASLGLGYWQTTGKIVLPQAIRLVIPPIVNTFIGLFKDTTLVGIVGLTDFLEAVQIGFRDLPWRPFYAEGYVFAALVYFVFCYAISKYSQSLETQFETGRQKRR